MDEKEKKKMVPQFLYGPDIKDKAEIPTLPLRSCSLHITANLLSSPQRNY